MNRSLLYGVIAVAVGAIGIAAWYVAKTRHYNEASNGAPFF